jgi:thioredoxin
MTNILELTTDTFDTALKDHPIILVDFWAEWCQPCKMMAPTFEKLAAYYADKIGHTTFAKVDVESNEALSDRFELRSIPTIIIFSNGIEVARSIGYQSYAALEKFAASI